jgi:hypothetical protein
MEQGVADLEPGDRFARRHVGISIVGALGVAGDGRSVGKPRYHRSYDDIGIEALRRPGQGRQPPGARHLIIVEKGDVAPPRRCDTGISRMGDPGPHLAEIAYRQGPSLREILNYLFGRSMCVIVDDDDFRRNG